MWNEGIEPLKKTVLSKQVLLESSFKLSQKEYETLLYNPMDYPNLPRERRGGYTF